jgi:hypothetical protein
MHSRHCAGFVVLLAGILGAGCGSGNSAHKYDTATQLAEALDSGGMTLQCDSADSGPGSAVVHGAISENMCYLPGSDSVSFLIDVFPGPVSKATLMANSVSTGDEQILSDLGPNWWVETDGTHVHHVQSILGGAVVAGKWKPDTDN